MPKVIVTGSSGQLGREFARSFFENGDAIIKGLDIKEDCDITDSSSVDKFFRDFTPDIVIHCAAFTNVDLAEKERDAAYSVNAAGTANIARACRRAGSRMIYISTDYVYDGAKTVPYVETDRPGPLNHYGYTKYTGEIAVTQCCRWYQIIRTSWLYDSTGNNFLTRMLDISRTKRAIEVVSNQTGAPTYVPDLVRATLKLAAKGEPGIYHISNGGCASWFDYAKHIFDYIGDKGISISPITAEKFGRPAKRPAYTVLDNGKFYAASGFRMRAWQDALRECVSVIKAQ